MLPIVLYNNMEAGTSNHNSSFGQLYDENVILNCVRTRKKVSELPNCPVCSCTIRQGELETHLSLEVDKLQKLSCSSGKRKLSVTISSNLAVPGSSTSTDVPDDQEVDVSGCLGSDIYQRVHENRLRRLRARRRSPPLPLEGDGECPVCNVTLPVARLQRHALRCLKRSGASVDGDLPDTSEEEGSIDVENDEPTSESGFGAEYQWCGEWRVRATALQGSQARVATCVRRASNDHALVVDGDEDAELYGPPQYSPSRIAADAEIIPSEDVQTNEDQEMTEENRRIEQNGIEDVPDLNETTSPKVNGLVAASAEEFEQFVQHNNSQQTRQEGSRREGPAQNGTANEHDILVRSPVKVTGLVEASAETRIQALREKIKELEKKNNGASETKCLICLAPYASPAVSIQCWHVYCETCWLQSLRAKKICPQCSAITTAQHLRRIYM